MRPRHATRARLRRVARDGRVTAQLLWFLASEQRRRDPYPAYGRLRRLDPVHHSPLGIWILTRHADVSEALRDPRLSSDERRVDTTTLNLGPVRRLLGRTDVVETGPFFEWAPELLLFRDPPDHTRIRGLVSRTFTPRRVRLLEPRIRAIADELIDGMRRSGHTELMSGFAYPFPARVICELIGVPPGDTRHITDHAPALAAGLDPGPLLTRQARDAANDATEALTAYLEHLIDHRRTTPGDDLLSELLHARDALSHDELVAILLLLLIAGHETTANLLGNGIVALDAQPEAAEELRGDRGMDERAVDELLRFDSPVQMTLRITAEAVTIAGRAIAPGSVVVLCTGAANHDPAVFDEPGRLSWHRDRNPHLAFGAGAHYCLGAPLARVEARIALRALLDRLPGLSLASEPVRRPSFTVRGLSSVDLRWSRGTPGPYSGER